MAIKKKNALVFVFDWGLLIILAVALALRLFVLFTEGNRLFLGTDDDNYRESAEILLRRGVLTYGGWPEPTVFIMPGYPLVLAGIFALAGSTGWLAARLFQVLISLVGVWLSVKIGDRLGGRRVGLLSGLFLAVYPPNLTAPGFLMTEVMFTSLFLGGLYLFIKAEEKGDVKWLVLTGFVLGLSTYFRPTGGLLPVVFGFYLLLVGHPWKRAVYAVVVMGAALVVCLSPWIVRNYLVYKEFIPFTVSGGNPFLRGTYINGKINEKFPWVKGDRILSDRAQMEYGRKRLTEGFRTDFGTYLRWYTLGKFRDFWVGPYYYKELTYLPRPLVKAFHLFLLGTGAAGLVTGFLRRQRLALLFLVVAGYFTVLHMVYLAAPRYSFPVVQLVVILAAYFIVEGYSFFQGLPANRR